ncbi:MAG: alpha/beta fold hydrolase [Polyangiaceae bacterium]
MTQPTIVFAHGAGAGSSSQWMRAWAARLLRLGHVVTFDYDYMAAGKRRPDPAPKLIATHEAAVESARRKGAPVVLAGKSMGSRIGCHVATRHPDWIRGLICFGYPLVGSGKTKPLRDQVLRELTLPILFLQGDRDALCPLDRLEAVRSDMTARSELHVVQGGDHSLTVGKRVLAAQGKTQSQIDDGLEATIASFIASLAL